MLENREAMMRLLPDLFNQHRILPVDDELIDQILKTAATSPYASGRTNWKVMVVRDKDLFTKLASAVHSRAETMASSYNFV